MVRSVISIAGIREVFLMDNFSIEVDSNFLATLPPGLQDDLKKDFEEYSGENSGCDCFIRMCPYCTVLVAFLRVDDKTGTHRTCVHCGETTPYDKCTQSINKAKILSELSLHCASGDETGKKTDQERVLLEQCIVLLATGIRVFFREVYGICMDLAYVKPEFSLYEKFKSGAKNDLENLGDTTLRFKTDLRMDLSEILGNDLIKKLDILMLKRDAIVCKNSRADRLFLNKSGIKGKVGSRIPVSHPEISDFIRTSEIVVDILQKECDNMISPEILGRIKARLALSLAILTFETPDPDNTIS